MEQEELHHQLTLTPSGYGFIGEDPENFAICRKNFVSPSRVRRLPLPQGSSSVNRIKQELSKLNITQSLDLLQIWFLPLIKTPSGFYGLAS